MVKSSSSQSYKNPINLKDDLEKQMEDAMRSVLTSEQEDELLGLLDQLSVEDLDVRAAAKLRFREVTTSSACLPWLYEMLGDALSGGATKASLACEVIRALGRAGVDDEESARLLSQAMVGGSHRLRDEAAKALVKLGPVMVPFVAPLLQQDDPYVKKRALWVLSEAALPVAEAHVYAYVSGHESQEFYAPSRLESWMSGRVGHLLGCLGRWEILGTLADCLPRINARRSLTNLQEQTLEEHLPTCQFYLARGRMVESCLFHASLSLVFPEEACPPLERPLLQQVAAWIEQGAGEGLEAIKALYKEAREENAVHPAVAALGSGPLALLQGWNLRSLARDPAAIEGIFSVQDPALIPALVRLLDTSFKRPSDGSFVLGVVNRDALILSIKRLHRRLCRETEGEGDEAHYVLLREMLQYSIRGDRWQGVCAYLQNWPLATRAMAVSYVEDHLGAPPKALQERWRQLCA